MVANNLFGLMAIILVVIQIALFSTGLSSMHEFICFRVPTPLRAVGLGLILMVVLVLYVQSTKGSGQGNTVGLIFTMGVLMPTLIVLGCFMKRTINGGQEAGELAVGEDSGTDGAGRQDDYGINLSPFDSQKLAIVAENPMVSPGWSLGWLLDTTTK
mmetsp:Transcript_86900/g.246246  ORF Transcript_86900/g.246246 Transcript_86900/m.246246 type:complete len:157 (-) Transcript_86900:380-850(-)